MAELVDALWTSLAEVRAVRDLGSRDLGFRDLGFRV